MFRVASVSGVGCKERGSSWLQRALQRCTSVTGPPPMARAPNHNCEAPTQLQRLSEGLVSIVRQESVQHARFQRIPISQSRHRLLCILRMLTSL